MVNNRTSIPKMRTNRFYYLLMCLKCEGMATTVDPYQSVSCEQFDLGLHSLVRPVCPDI